MYLVKEKLIKSMMMLSIILLVFISLSVILFGVQQFKISSQFASINQVSNLSHILVRQQANLLSSLLSKNASNEKLIEHLDHLASEEFVLDVSIYNQEGKLLAQSSGFNNLRTRLGLDNNQSSSLDTQQVVEPIYDGNRVEGFLRVTFDNQYAQTSQGKINQIFHKLYAELIVVFLLGVVLASSFHYFLSHYRRAYRRNRIKTNAISPPPKTKPLASLNFHRRRRRF